MLPPPDDTQFLCQNHMELMAMLSFVRGAKSILEVGSRYGQTLLHLAQNAPGAKIVTVDLGDCPDKLKDGIKTHLWWDEACMELKKTHEVHQIYGDSHSPEIIDQIKKLGPYDCAMIDGDHSLEGCKADWDNFGNLARTVIFHDTRTLPSVAQVFQLARYNKPASIELLAMNGFGIGIIFNG